VPEALVQLEQPGVANCCGTAGTASRTHTEMRTSFAGASQELAIRVQGLDYLTGSCLAAAAEQLELVPRRRRIAKPVVKQSKPAEAPSSNPQFAEPRFQSTKKIRPIAASRTTTVRWQLRCTFEPVHAERVSMVFNPGRAGRCGSNLQNILISSAVISVLYNLHDDRLHSGFSECPNV